MLPQFQKTYPNGSIISELIQIFQGKYIVRVSIQLEGVTRTTAMSAADTIETAEDQAIHRALMLLGIKEIPEETKTLAVSQPVNISNHHAVTNTIPLSKVSNVSSNYTPSVMPTTLEQPENLSVINPEIKAEISKSDILAFPETEYEPPSNVTPFPPRIYTSMEDTSESSMVKRNKKSQPINLSDVIAQTNVEIERLGWTQEQGKDYLMKTYGKPGRSKLSEDELRDFLVYLKSQPDPIAGF